MSGRQVAGRHWLPVLCAATLLVACSPAASEAQIEPTSAASPSVATPSPAPSATPALSPLALPTGHPIDVPAEQALRLPTPADLGPNYFELFSAAPDADPSVRSAAVIGFGFSERAKLPDERIERDGPMSVIARITEHPTDDEAARFAAETSVASGFSMPDSGYASSALGLLATLAGLPPTHHELAPDLPATRTLATGWLRALDGSRTPTALETWTIKRAQTVMTVILVWRGRPGDGWAESLLERLVHTAPGKAAPGAA